MKAINYFDTPEDRRKGRGGMADFMGKVIDDYDKRIEKTLQSLPKKYIHLSELKEKLYEKHS